MTIVVVAVLGLAIFVAGWIIWVLTRLSPADIASPAGLQALGTVLLVLVTIVFVVLTWESARHERERLALERERDVRRKSEAERERQRHALLQVWVACRQAQSVFSTVAENDLEIDVAIDIDLARAEAAEWDDRVAPFETALLEAVPDLPEPFRSEVYDLLMLQLPFISHILWYRASVREYDGVEAERFKARSADGSTVHGLALDSPWRKVQERVRKLQEDIAEHLAPRTE